LKGGQDFLTESGAKLLDVILAWWMGVVRRFALWVVLVSIMATGATLYYTITNLEIDTNLDAMLSRNLPFRRIYEDYKKAFPQDISTILLVIDGETPDLAEDSSKALADRLGREKALFKSVYVPGGDRFFEEHALLYLSLPELEDLTDHLVRVQPFLAKLTLDPSLRGLFTVLTNALDSMKGGEEIDLTPFFDRMSRAIEATLRHKHDQLSWLELMDGRPSTPDERRRFIVAEPKLDFSKLQPAEAAMSTIKRLAQELHLDESHGIRLRITGDIALDYDELKTVSRGAAIATVFSFVLVLALLMIGLGSLWLVVTTLVTLIFGLVWTTGFAILAVGHLNLFSVTFAALYIGMAVDYSIHFCLRYKELLKFGMGHSGSLSGAAKGVGKSLIVGATILVIGFYSFLPTTFVGVSELGLITGTGMFIGLFATLTVLPAMLHLRPLGQRAISKPPAGRWMSIFKDLASGHGRTISLVALVLGLAALPFLPRITFDPNPLRLKDQKVESVSTFNELLANPGSSPWTIMVVAKNGEVARKYVDQLGKQKLVDKALILDDFVPEKQDQKLALIENISLLMGPELLEVKPQSPPYDDENVAALHEFQKKMETYLGSARKSLPVAQRLLDSLSTFNVSLKAEVPHGQGQLLEALQISLLGSLPGRLQALRSALSPHRITIENLPKSLVERWVAKDGRYRIEVYPRENLYDNAALARFVDAVRSVTPDITGFPVIILEAGKAVVTAFKQASLWSLVAIIVLLLIFLPRKSDTLLVLLPLGLAWVLTAALMVLLHIQFNFTNVIDLPLLLSYGANSGIYMIYRARTKMTLNEHLLQTSTTRAVIFCALTTFASFANLSISSHPGLASMGQLLTLGLGLILCCDLIVLPALLAYQPKRGGRR
jgi:hopanoid biosynthesis associated RND transporter like protein HpnN